MKIRILSSFHSLWIAALTILVVQWGACASLDDLFISGGYIQFSPTITHYDIPVTEQLLKLLVVPYINNSSAVRPRVYVGIGTETPTITVPGIGKEFDVRDKLGSKFTVTVDVKEAGGANQQYVLNFDESHALPNLYIRRLEVTDQNNNRLEITPSVDKDIEDYTLASQPQTTHLYFNGACENGSKPKINGTTNAVVPRDKALANQLVTVTCEGKDDSRSYFVQVRSQTPDLSPPDKLVVLESGKVCKVSEEKPITFFCEAEKSTASFIATIDSQYRYTVRDDSGSIDVRLLNGEASGPVPLHSGLYIHGVAGTENKKWPLQLNGSFFPSGGNVSMRMMGWIVGCLLMLTIAVLLIVLTLSSALGMGTPFGASVVPSTLAFLLQFFCLANAMRGAPTLLSDMTTPLKYITLWWPLPWTHDGEVSVFHPENAAGCLFWSLILFVGLLCGRCIIWLKFGVLERGHTYPHRMLIGNWEARLIHFLCFPAAAASTLLLTHPQSTAGHRVMGSLTLAGLIIWTVAAFFLVKRIVKSRKVVWIWNQSLREDDESEMVQGYWGDVKCYQINTEPTNRSLCRFMFPWRWISTAADIEPIVIASPPGHANDDDDTAAMTLVTSGPTEDYTTGSPGGRRGATNEAPMGKSPRNVQIYRTRSPGWCCRGQNLVVGLFRTQWLDVLFTYLSITKLNDYADRHGINTRIPLTVKTNQLSGPLTGGYYCFFFDGVRIPFIRIGQQIYRICAGVMLGVALASTKGWLDGLCFLVVCAASFAGFFYTFKSCPFNRRVENVLLAMMQLTVTFCALAFMGVSFTGNLNILLDALLWLTAIACFCLSAYSVFITFNILSALICPPLEEFRFLERLCNTDVTISSHDEGFQTTTMAYNRYGTRDIVLQCSTIKNSKDVTISASPSDENPCIEIPAEDMIAACRTGLLPVPRVCIFLNSKDDPLGYRHMNLYDRANLSSKISSFLVEDKNIYSYLSKLTQAVMRQIETRSHDSAVLTLTIVPATTNFWNDWSTAGKEAADDATGVGSSYGGSRLRSLGFGRTAHAGYSRLPTDNPNKAMSKNMIDYSGIEMRGQ